METNAGVLNLTETGVALSLPAPPDMDDLLQNGLDAPPSRYAATSRRACRVLSRRIAAAETSVRRFANTSERTSMRRSSCLRRVKRSNLRLRHLSEG